jgi:hypothetical protein
MRIPGLKTLKRGLKQMRSQLTSGGALILGYHRIAEGENDPYSLCVSTSNFQDQLDVLQHEVQPISLQLLVEGLYLRDVPQRAVVITFDDGTRTISFMQNHCSTVFKFLPPSSFRLAT